MYVPQASWSIPDKGDPGPCFRQGDLVRLRYAQPDVVKADQESFRLSMLDVRTEVVALLSTCCDLVYRQPLKRKGVLISPLREVPKHVRKSEALLAALKATAAEAVKNKIDVPANLFFFEELPGITKENGAVVHLEAISMVSFDQLVQGDKLAELGDEARVELRERLKFHFTR